MSVAGSIRSGAAEFVRFAVVGLLSNAILFLLYLSLTSVGLGHKLAASVVYAIGVLQTFVLNRRWSFQHTGAAAPALGRYVIAYGLGYVLNIAVLFIYVDLAHYSHGWVEGVMIVVLAALLFLAQKFWVFREERCGDRT